MLFAVVLIHVVMQMRRKDLSEAERKHNFPRVVITTMANEVKGNDRSEMGWIDPTAATKAEDEAEAVKQKKEEDKEWARDEIQCACGIAIIALL